nr:hypothetical protein [Tanacetum cinerariifolium]
MVSSSNGITPFPVYMIVLRVRTLEAKRRDRTGDTSAASKSSLLQKRRCLRKPITYTDGHLSEWRIRLLKSVKGIGTMPSMYEFMCNIGSHFIGKGIATEPDTNNSNLRERRAPTDYRTEGPTSTYMHLGDCKHACQHRGALFWYKEHAKTGHSLGRKDQ